MTENPKARVAHTVSLDQRGLLVDGAFRPLVAGMFEYWRHNSLHWRRILRLMKESGLDFIAPFVCWDVHELERGDFDFVGRTHPSRDLAGFIDMAKEEGLDTLIRVGPIIDAEWPTRGPAPDVTPLERLHPRYLERTREYIEALAPILVPRLATRGGPIYLASIDNEAYYPYSTDVESDPSQGSMHVPYDADLVMSRYRQWLEKRYGHPEALGSAWGRSGLSFAEVGEPNYRQAGLRETLDSFDYISDSLHEAFSLLKAMCVEAGIDVPIYTNMKQFTHYIDWRAIEEMVDSHGLNLHMPNAWPGDQKLVASWYCRLLRSRVRFPWAPEFQGATGIGLDHIFGILDANQGRFTSLLAMAFGLRGLSYYPFVERDDTHFAPISPIGKVRPALAGFRDAIGVLKQLRPDRHLAEVGLLWSLDHHRAQVASRFSHWRNLYDIWIDMAEPKELGPWWQAFRELHDTDTDFDIVPLDQDLDAYKVLIYAGPDFGRRAHLENLKSWLAGGGRLIAVTSLPTRSVEPEAEGNLFDLAEEISRSGNVTLRPWGGLSDALEGGATQPAIRAQLAGLWTFAYQDKEGWTLFVANAGTSPAPAEIRLGPDLLERLAGKTVTDLLSGRQWSIPGAGLWDRVPTLAPNDVHVLRVRA